MMDEETTLTPEELEAAKQKALALLVEEHQESLKKESWFKKVAKYVWTFVKPIVQIVFSGVKETVSFIINNAENQNLAKLAIIAAAQAGLKGNAAWLAAMAIFKAGKICIGAGKYIECSKIETNIRETLLQLVYTCLKNSELGKKLLTVKAPETTQAVFPELPEKA